MNPELPTRAAQVQHPSLFRALLEVDNEVNNMIRTATLSLMLLATLSMLVVAYSFVPA
jgi:hypothetical protein